MWADKIGQKKTQRRFNRDIAYKLITNKEAIPFLRFFQLANRSGLRGHRYKIFDKSGGAMKQRFSAAGYSRRMERTGRQNSAIRNY